MTVGTRAGRHAHPWALPFRELFEGAGGPERPVAPAGNRHAPGGPPKGTLPPVCSGVTCRTLGGRPNVYW